MRGPYDNEDYGDNNDILYVGDPDDLPNIWEDTTTLMEPSYFDE